MDWSEDQRTGRGATGIGRGATGIGRKANGTGRVASEPAGVPADSGMEQEVQT